MSGVTSLFDPAQAKAFEPSVVSHLLPTNYQLLEFIKTALQITPEYHQLRGMTLPDLNRVALHLLWECEQDCLKHTQAFEHMEVTARRNLILKKLAEKQETLAKAAHKKNNFDNFAQALLKTFEQPCDENDPAFIQWSLRQLGIQDDPHTQGFLKYTELLRHQSLSTEQKQEKAQLTQVLIDHYQATATRITQVCSASAMATSAESALQVLLPKIVKSTTISALFQEVCVLTKFVPGQRLFEYISPNQDPIRMMSSLQARAGSPRDSWKSFVEGLKKEPAHLAKIIRDMLIPELYPGKNRDDLNAAQAARLELYTHAVIQRIKAEPEVLVEAQAVQAFGNAFCLPRSSAPEIALGYELSKKSTLGELPGFAALLNQIEASTVQDLNRTLPGLAAQVVNSAHLADVDVLSADALKPVMNDLATICQAYHPEAYPKNSKALYRAVLLELAKIPAEHLKSYVDENKRDQALALHPFAPERSPCMLTDIERKEFIQQHFLSNKIENTGDGKVKLVPVGEQKPFEEVRDALKGMLTTRLSAMYPENQAAEGAQDLMNAYFQALSRYEQRILTKKETGPAGIYNDLMGEMVENLSKITFNRTSLQDYMKQLNAETQRLATHESPETMGRERSDGDESITGLSERFFYKKNGAWRGRGGYFSWNLPWPWPEDWNNTEGLLNAFSRDGELGFAIPPDCIADKPELESSGTFLGIKVHSGRGRHLTNGFGLFAGRVGGGASAFDFALRSADGKVANLRLVPPSEKSSEGRFTLILGKTTQSSEIDLLVKITLHNAKPDHNHFSFTGKASYDEAMFKLVARALLLQRPDAVIECNGASKPGQYNVAEKVSEETQKKWLSEVQNEVAQELQQIRVADIHRHALAPPAAEVFHLAPEPKVSERQQRAWFPEQAAPRLYRRIEAAGKKDTSTLMMDSLYVPNEGAEVATARVPNPFRGSPSIGSRRTSTASANSSAPLLPERARVSSGDTESLFEL